MQRMKRLIYRFAGSLVGLLVMLAAIGLLLPSTAHVERQILIQAEPDQVFPFLNAPRAFNLWSPWARRDPSTQYRFSGPEQGVGAHMAWHSEHPQVGSGSQEIIASVINQRVAVALDFGAQGTAVAYYDLQRIEGATEVSWGFDTDFGYDIVGRYVGLLFERWIGPDYEQGLANLKQLVEAPPATPID